MNGNEQIDDRPIFDEVLPRDTDGRAEPAPTPLVVIDDSIRGRWKLALGLGAILGLILGVVGYICQ